jgi:hypothetical protein
MTPDMIVMAIGVAAALVLALRGLRSQRLSFERKAAMVVAWVIIIAVLAFLVDRLQG